MTLYRSGSFGCCGCSRRLAAGWGLRCPAAAAGLDRMYACKRSTGPLDGLPCADCPGRTGRTLKGSPWPLSSARLPVRGSRPGAIAAEKKKFPPVRLDAHSSIRPTSAFAKLALARSCVCIRSRVLLIWKWVANPMARLHCNSLHADKPLDCRRAGGKISSASHAAAPLQDPAARKRVPISCPSTMP